MNIRSKFDWRKLQEHRVYTYDELYERLRCGPDTLKRVLREEQVPVIDDKMPALVVGADLIPALRAQSKPARLQSGQMFCFGCKQPSFPAAGMIDDVAEPTEPPHLQALCERCGTVMYRRVAKADKTAFFQAAQRAVNNGS